MTDDFQFSTPAFDEGDRIPERYTCDGRDVSPPISIGELPPEAESFAIIVDDPDAPGGAFTHWFIWNLPPALDEIPEEVPTQVTVNELNGAHQGENDFDEVGYRGPCPPEGHSSHTYHFNAYALDDTIHLDDIDSRKALDDAKQKHTVGTASFTGTYER